MPKTYRKAIENASPPIVLSHSQPSRLHHEQRHLASSSASSAVGEGVDSLTELCRPHFDFWSQIRIMDIPVGEPGRYTIVDPRLNLQVDNQKGAALGSLVGIYRSEESFQSSRAESYELYWCILGRLIFRTPSGYPKVGRCFSCAAAVCFSLVSDSRFDDYTIEAMGNPDYDHYLVRVHSSTLSPIYIDVWQENINHQKPSAVPNPSFNPVFLPEKLPYTGGNIKVLCEFAIGTDYREYLRSQLT